MTKRKITYASFQSAVTAPGAFGGLSSLSTEKQSGIEMYLDQGVLMVHYKTHDIGIPLTNIKALVFEREIISMRKAS